MGCAMLRPLEVHVGQQQGHAHEKGAATKAQNKEGREDEGGEWGMQC